MSPPWRLWGRLKCHRGIDGAKKTQEIATAQSEINVSTQIEERIFTIRGKQVIIDKDLALLYGVETKRLNEPVKRNIERFPEDFMFQLTMEEFQIVTRIDLKSQIATSSWGWHEKTALRLYRKWHRNVEQCSEKRDRHWSEHQNHANIYTNQKIHIHRFKSIASNRVNRIQSVRYEETAHGNHKQGGLRF